MNKNSFYTGPIIATLFSLPLVLVWLTMASLQARFTDIPTAMTSIGQLTGLIGTALFALTLVLATRLRFMENIFRGLNQVYINHHQIAAASFILLLVHPLFLMVKYLQFSTQSAAQFLLPSSYLPITWGILALAGMMTLLVLTFYASLRYQIWKLSHRLLGFVYVIALLHILTIPSDISRNGFIRYYLLALSVLALVGFVYKSLLGKYLVKRYKYSVSNVKLLKPNVFELALTPKNQGISFLPGQFVFVKFLNSSLGQEEHPFSISSSATEQVLTVTVKMLGDYTGKIKQLVKGTKALVDGPYGRFSAEFGGNKQVWIAGGIGITPFISMAKSLHDNKNVILYYCLNNPEETIYEKEFDEIAQKPNFKVVKYYSDTQGRFSIDKVKASIPDFEGRDFYICGPPAMMKSLKQQLVESGINKNKIYTEEFGLL